MYLWHSQSMRGETIGNSILPLFARRADGSGLLLIWRRRASRPYDVAPAPGRLQCRFGRNGANSETRGAIGWCGGASTAALAPRTALRDVVDRMVGDGDERVSRPLGRLRGRAPLGGLLACAHRLEPCAGGGPSCGVVLALPSIRRLPCSLNVQAALSLPWARSFALGHRAWSTRWPNPAPPCPACRATGRAA